nr:reverse transcriptase domain-containing protein [Tanacetum cinerariifolium]
MANPDDELIWASDRVVAPTPGLTITIPATANDSKLKEISCLLSKETNSMRIKNDPHKHIHEFLSHTVDFNSDDEDEESISIPQTQTPKPNKETAIPKAYKPRIPYPQCLRKKKMKAQYEKLLNTIHVIRINVSLVDVLAGMPNYGKFLKELHSYSNNDTCFSIDVINEILEEDFDSLLDEGSKILYSIKGTPLEDKIFAEFNEFIAMNIEESNEPKIIEEEITFKKITFDTDYKINKSLDKPPTDLELKPLPGHLEYAFLEEPFFLPVVVSSWISKQNKEKLISVLKRHNQAFAWKTTDIL